MSSSHPAHTKIEFLDPPHIVRSKISSAPCSPTSLPPENGILALLRDVIWPISEQRMERGRGEVGANPEEGRDVGEQRPFCGDGALEGTLFSVATLHGVGHYNTYPALETDFRNGIIPPDALKSAIIDALNALLAPIRKAYAENEEWQAADKLAYPDEELEVLC